MKTIKTIRQYAAVLSVVALTAQVSCTRHEEIIGGGAVPMHFSAKMETSGAGTKVILDGGPSDDFRRAMWLPQDSICVINGTVASTFVNVLTDTSETAQFDGTLPKGTSYYAAYPVGMVFGYEASSFGFILPAVQKYYAGGVSSDGLPMVAKCSNDNFTFKNLCGVLVLNLTSSDSVNVSSIAFSGNDEDGNPLPISGSGTVSMDYNDEPVLKMDAFSGTSTSVTIDCPEGVKLNPTEPTSFHIVLPPSTYSTFSVYILDKGGHTLKVEGVKPLKIERAKRTITAAKAIKYEYPKEYVDLGLSVKWATCNVGASSIYDYGDYYAWGETETKSEYSWETYKYSNSDGTVMLKYNTDAEYGTVDNKVELEEEDDVASVKWGDDWRIPTLPEWEELISNCTWEEMVIRPGDTVTKISSNVQGFIGNYIILPRAGSMSGEALWGRGSFGLYWSSYLQTDEVWAAWSGNAGKWVGYSSRDFGRSVRPVYGKRTEVAFPVVKTTFHSVSSSSAVIGGQVMSQGGTQLLSYGVVLGKSESPTLEQDSVIRCSSLEDSLFSGNLRNLTPGTKYYARTYASNVKGTSYGEQVSFTCSGQETMEYVDLGLSVKWATCNIGASTPEGFGDYYAWGETETKSEYSWETYKYCNGTMYTLTKYNFNSECGTVDNKFELEASDDVASEKWGEEWRMPSLDEWNELRANCTWEWTSRSGIEGYKITSNVEGHTDKSIFLPAAGDDYDCSHLHANWMGEYWLSDLWSYEPSYGTICDFRSKNPEDYYSICGSFRSQGNSIRPVYGPRKERTVPTVNTVLHSASSYSAVVGGKITSTGGSSITSYGVVWSESENPTVELETKIQYDGQPDSVFAAYIRELNTNKTYYARTFAKNVKGISYGEQVSFSCSGQETKEYVNLGLSVKWATCNVGASASEQYGDYYAWGETEAKLEYYWDTYKYCDGTITTLNKYNTNPEYGKVDDKLKLDIFDDAANVQWGEGWRMPSMAEWNELIDNCTWEWTSYSGVTGYKVTSKVEGYTDKYIFLPAAGQQYLWNRSANEIGCYFANELFDYYEASYSICGVYCFFGKNIEVSVSGELRAVGQSIRPVYDLK